MSERRIKSSHPDFKKLDELSSLIALSKNPNVTYHTRLDPDNENIDLPDVERRALVKCLEEEMGKELDLGVFADFVGLIKG